jgi:hypothetical protein
MSKRIELTVSEELWDRIEVARGDVPRAAFVKRVLEVETRAFLVEPEIEPPFRVPSPERTSARAPRHAPTPPGSLPRSAMRREIVEPVEDWAWERQQRLNRNRKP